MTNKRSTKRALVLSVLALVLAITMLMGTTYAWFTDSVSSVNNIIKSGSLDVELEYYDGSKWTAVDENTNVFSNNLWEPGHTEVVYLRVANVGSLALKYSLSVNIASEVLGTNVDGKTFKLSDYIYYDAIETGDENFYGSRTEARKAVVNGKKISNNYVDVKSMTPGTDEYVTLVVYMPESVGNEANAKAGTVAPEIELGINLYATQYTYEYDSFGNDYDDIANVPVADIDTLDADTVLATKGIGGEEFKLPLDVKYSFKPSESYEEAQASGYRYWHADFVVKADKDVPAESMALGGYYDAWCQYNEDRWVALTSPETIKANTEIRLVYGMGNGSITVNYEELCEYGNDGIGFLCGASDLTGENAGTTLTVELRIYETYSEEECEEECEELFDYKSKNEETGKYITIGSYSYTFAKEVASKADIKTGLSNGITVFDAKGAEIGDLNYGLNVPAGTTVTIKNAVISGKSYGNATNGTVVFENCTFTNTGAYSIHFDAGNGKVVFNNCTLEGWCSFGAAISAVEMNNCNLKGNGTYAMYRFYQPTVLNNCTIDASNANHGDNYADGLSAVSGSVLTLNGCTLIYSDYEVEEGAIVIDGTTVLDSAAYTWIKNADR